MCSRRESIEAVSNAADQLARACFETAQPIVNGPSEVARALKRAFRTTLVNPADMLKQLGKMP